MSHFSVRPSDAVQTVHANDVLCSVDGGAFLIHLYENRPVKTSTFETMFSKDNSAFVEVGRIAMGPVALQILREQIDTALQAHEYAAGELPKPVEYLAKVAQFLGGRAISMADQLFLKSSGGNEDGKSVA